MTAESTQGRQAAIAAAQVKIVDAARSQLGVPYVYGGEEPGVCFDCSGLAQWCCSQAGIAIPRGSAGQFNASGPRVDDDIQPGDLVYFYGGEEYGPRPGHVGIACQRRQMIDAPYTGVDVRYDTFTTTPFVGALDFWGATRPAELVTVVDPLPPAATLVDVQLRVLSTGCKGYDVKSLQLLLNGYDGAGLVVDADFGPLTEQAVRHYQTVLGYAVDGVVGAVTWRSILGAPNP
jgi:hypothetical protein